MTALSTSAASASATLVMTAAVDGLRVGKVLPEAESTHLLLMSSLVAETFTVGSKTADAVAMAKSSYAGEGYSGGAVEARIGERADLPQSHRERRSMDESNDGE